MRIVVLSGLSCILLIFSGSCASNSSANAYRPSRAGACGLVDVGAVVPGIVCDLRYKTKDNVVHQTLYSPDMPCLLYHVTAEKLAHAQALLRDQGYGLKIWDAWRPPEVQLALFEHGGYTGMFTDPGVMWSRHCSGTAVDVTLVDDRGRELEMPTRFDNGGALAHHIYNGSDPAVRERVQALQLAMLEAGFSLLDTEWWHFDDNEFNVTPPPPPVFAHDLGIKLPEVKGRRSVASRQPAYPGQ